jgi:hypothetical protein
MNLKNECEQVSEGESQHPKYNQEAKFEHGYQ